MNFSTVVCNETFQTICFPLITSWEYVRLILRSIYSYSLTLSVIVFYPFMSCSRVDVTNEGERERKRMKKERLLALHESNIAFSTWLWHLHGCLNWAQNRCISFYLAVDVTQMHNICVEYCITFAVSNVYILT